MSKTPFRLTVNQADLIYVGIRPIIINYLNRTNIGASPGCHPDILTLQFHHRRGIFNKRHMDAIIRLWKRFIAGRSNGVRLSLDYAEIATCALAVRNAVRQVQHGHITPWADGIEGTAKRLLMRLEALRKKRKRKIIKTKGQQFFRELATSWSEHLKWMRLNLLVCSCPIRRPNLTYRFHQLLISKVARVTRSELDKRGFKVPEEKPFRKLIRDSLKNVRRLRTPWTIPMLSRNPGTAAFWFGNYIERRLASKLT
jgi:hypothetical protein